MKRDAARWEILAVFVLTVCACAFISQLFADNAVEGTATELVSSQRQACERANERFGSRGNQRFLLKLVRDLAQTSTPETRATLASRKGQIDERIAAQANRNCVKDYPNP